MKYLLIIILIVGINSGSEKRLSELASDVYQLIQKIRDSETRYFEKRKSEEWKTAYESKRSELEGIFSQLEDKVKEGRFLEQIPDEKLNKKVNSFLHTVENVKIYITTTNVDLTQYLKGAPPATDRYNWDRFIKPAIEQLSKINPEIKLNSENKKIK